MPKLATIAAFGFPDFNPPTLLKLYRRMGCVTCQFYRNINNQPKPADARKIANDAGLPFDSIHGVFGAEYDPSNPDETIRRTAIETYRSEGGLALSLGGPAVVVHPAPMLKDTERVTPQTLAARIGPMQRSMEELAVIGKSTGVTYLIENIPTNYHFGFDAVQLAGMVRNLNHPNIRMCYDTGHAHMFSDPAVALESCRDVVTYFHVHDNDTTKDAHDIPGHGTLPWEKLGTVMAKCSKDVPAMLELFQSEPTLEGEIKTGLPGKLKRWLAV